MWSSALQQIQNKMDLRRFCKPARLSNPHKPLILLKTTGRKTSPGSVWQCHNVMVLKPSEIPFLYYLITRNFHDTLTSRISRYKKRREIKVTLTISFVKLSELCDTHVKSIIKKEWVYYHWNVSKSHFYCSFFLRSVFTKEFLV